MQQSRIKARVLCNRVVLNCWKGSESEDVLCQACPPPPPLPSIIHPSTDHAHWTGNIERYRGMEAGLHSDSSPSSSHAHTYKCTNQNKETHSLTHTQVKYTTIRKTHLNNHS